jgi:hypothetical protein
LAGWGTGELPAETAFFTPQNPEARRRQSWRCAIGARLGPISGSDNNNETTKTMSDIDDGWYDDRRKASAYRARLDDLSFNRYRSDEDKLPPCEFEDPAYETSDSETNNDNQ